MYSTKKWSFPIALILVGLLITGAVVYMSIPKFWEEATTTNEDGTIDLSDQWKETIEKKQEQFEVHDLYKLTASLDGYFLCEHCPTGKFFLKAGETYRYGTTGLGQEGRGYNEQWLNDHLLNYVLIITEDIATVKAQQATLIGTYAILPENLARPLPSSPKAKLYWYRLVLPPGNNSLD